MNKLKQIWTHLRSIFWFVPSLIVAVSIALAVALVAMGYTGSNRWLDRWPLLFGTGAEGARGMLSTIAGSMIALAGVTFSMTLVTLTLAASQYTSRILRNFMRDRVTQVVLGVFTGIFIYCLVVLRTIRGGEEGAFIPNLAVFFSVVLAIGGISVLIFFIHHIASSIQASNIIASVAAETLVAVERHLSEKSGDGPIDPDEEQPPESPWQAVAASVNGYIQNVDIGILLRLARKNQTIVRMEQPIGAFVVQGTPLAWVALTDPPKKEIIDDLQAAYSINRYRTVEHDSAFGIRQIVDMALRALSPGINDTTTAVMCVDYLTAILTRLAPRQIPSSHLYEDGELRVITIGPTFEDLLAESFNQIRNNAKGNVAIMLRILGALQTIAGHTTGPVRQRALHDHVQWISELADRTLDSAHDRAKINTRLAHVREAEPFL